MSEHIVLSAFTFLNVISAFIDVKQITFLHSCWLSSKYNKMFEIDKVRLIIKPNKNN